LRCSPNRREHATLRNGPICEVATVGREGFVEIDAALASRVSIVSKRRLREAACECYTAPVEYEQRLAASPPLQRETQ
jgi:hypothetical protein